MATGEMVMGNIRLEHQRMPDEQSLAERLLSKWVSRKSYMKVNGEWLEAPNCCPEEGWYHFLDTGMTDAYQKYGTRSKEWKCNGLPI